MAELVGLLLGVTGPLEQVITLLEQLKQRHDAVKSHHHEITSLVATYRRMSTSLKGIQLSATADRLSKQARLDVEANLTLLEQTVQKALTELRDKCRKINSRLYRFTNAFRNAEYITALNAKAEYCTLLITNITCLLAVVAVPSEVAALVNPTAPGQHNQPSSTSHASPSTVTSLPTPPPGQDQFIPSFAVERNDKTLTLDFLTTDHTGAFVTVEARLKAVLLGNTPTVGAVAGSGDRGGVGVGTIATGVGGVGKTCALRAIACEPDVIARFPGGVYFRTLGRDARLPDVIAMLSYFVRISGGRQVARRILEEEQHDLDIAVSSCCAWFRGQNCLFIIDDVWNSRQYLPNDLLRKLGALAGCSDGGDPDVGVMGQGGSRVMYSTRDKQIASAARGAVVEFNRRDVRGELSLRMLLDAANIGLDMLRRDPRIEEYANRILDACGGLPFALNIAGGLLHELQDAWGTENSVSAWQDCADKLSEAENLLNNEDESYFISLLASIQFLDKHRSKDGKSYERAVSSLCVLKKQQWIPLSVCKRLWGVDTDRERESMLRNLWAVGIVDRENRHIEGKPTQGLRYHDHVHSCAIWLANNDCGVPRWYASIIQSYRNDIRSEQKDICWPARAVDDGFVIQNVCRLILGSGEIEQAVKTLRSGQWVTRMMFLGARVQYDQDISLVSEHLMQAAISGSSNQDEKWEDILSSLKTLSNIIHMSQPSCRGHMTAAWFQLYSRIAAHDGAEKWIGPILEEVIQFAPRPFLRPITSCLRPVPRAQIAYYPFPFNFVDVRFLPSGEVIAAGSSKARDNGQINVSIFSEKEVVKTLKMQMYTIHREMHEPSCLCLSEDGLLVASGHYDGSIRLWNVRSGEQLCGPLLGHTGWVYSVHFSADGKRVGSGGKDRTVRVWDVKSGRQVGMTMAEHEYTVRVVRMNRDGTRIASICEGGEVKVIDIHLAARIFRTSASDEGTSARMDMTPDGKFVVFAFDRETVAVWNPDKGPELQKTIKIAGTWIMSLAVSADGRFAYTGSIDGEHKLLEIEGVVKVVNTIRIQESSVERISPDRNGHRIVSSTDKWLGVWDLKKLGYDWTGFKAHKSSVKRVAMSDDGRRVVTSGLEPSVKAWDTQSCSLACDPLEGHTGWVLGLFITADGKKAASGSDDKTVFVWDLDNGNSICGPLMGHTSLVRSIAMSADGGLVASGSDDGTVRVWNATTGQPVHVTLTGHTGLVRSVAITLDGARVVSGSDDHTLRVWDPVTGKQIGPALHGHSDSVRYVTVSEDGKRAFSGARDKTRKCWDLEKMCCLRTVHVDYDDDETYMQAQMVEDSFIYDVEEVEVEKKSYFLYDDGSFTMKQGKNDLVKVAEFDNAICDFTVSKDGKTVVVGLDYGILAIMHLET